MERSSAEKCLSFININLSPPENAEEGKSRLGERPVITISRQSGAGGMTIADEVANYLNARLPRHGVPWTVFDKNLVQKVIEAHELPEKLAQFMTEDKRVFYFQFVFCGIDVGAAESCQFHSYQYVIVASEAGVGQLFHGNRRRLF